jgi:hypothetical protein
MVEFCELAFHFLAAKGLADDELEEVLDFLFGKTMNREKSELSSLFRAHRAFSTVAQSRDSSHGEFSDGRDARCFFAHQNPNLGNFWRALEWQMLGSMYSYGHLVSFSAILYIL